jgi:hypothetical protein
MEDYPRSLMEFEARFSREESCRDYLYQMRWPDGFRCPRCSHEEAWPIRATLFQCVNCGYRTSVIAGTIFQDTKKPLRLWFRAIWHLTSQKYGANALGLQRVLGVGSYHIAWTWLHKLRRAMVRPGRDRLSGTVEVDETYIGGEKPGKRGRGAAGKVLVVVMVERRQDRAHPPQACTGCVCTKLGRGRQGRCRAGQHCPHGWMGRLWGIVRSRLRTRSCPKGS